MTDTVSWVLTFMAISTGLVLFMGLLGLVQQIWGKRSQ